MLSQKSIWRKLAETMGNILMWLRGRRSIFSRKMEQVSKTRWPWSLVPNSPVIRPHSSPWTTPDKFDVCNCAAFLCVADEGYGRILPAAYLDKLAADWAAEVGDKLPRDGVQEGQLTATYSWVDVVEAATCMYS
jgi:hypothetical protein